MRNHTNTRIALFILARVSLCAVLLLTSISQALGDEASRAELMARIKASVAAGTEYLVKRQDADGTWRSTTYGLLKDGTSLTPLVMSALPESEATRAVRARALKTMSDWIVQEGQAVRVGIAPQYPVYTAGLCLQVLSTNSSPRSALEEVAWSQLLHDHQLNRHNGWLLEDARIGGWGYSHESPKKPEPGQELGPLDEPNLSATVFALEGLVAMDPEGRTNIHVRRMALQFVQRCQNYRESANNADSQFNDGGFHFMLADAVRNKPGVAGIDSTGETRFISYGSATADGIRSLLLCGVEPTQPRVVAARRWLLDHFQDGTHSGSYPDDRRSLKPSLDYYYAASVARALRNSQPKESTTPDSIEWAAVLAARIASQQQQDGSWVNQSVDVREDDPIIATSLALLALTRCEEQLSSPAVVSR